MRRTDPLSDDQPVVTEPGQTTTRFQPHRAVKSRRAIRGPWQPAVGLCMTILFPILYAEAQGREWYVRLMIAALLTLAVSLVTRWIIDLLLWAKEN